MATTETITEEVTYTTLTDGVASATVDEETQFEATSSYDFPQQFVQQKVWDTVEGDWVVWETEEVDLDGGQYPGPGTWGANTSDYRVLNVKFTRIQS